jgi:hypothetical protein
MMSAMPRSLPATIAAAAIVAVLAGCGGSSKPSYCSQTSALKKSVKDLGSVNVLQGGTSGLSSALQTVETNAQKVVSSAKSDFPSQTDAVNSAISALKETAQSLAASPAQPALIAKLPGEISAVASSIQSFASATSSKCG